MKSAENIVYKGMTRREIEKQYMLRNTRPNYETTDIPRWMEMSERFRSYSINQLDLVYGPLPRNTLDFFTPNANSLGFILYIHGGYWQRGDKSVYSFIAEPFVKRGYSVAVMNYQMCPDVKLTEIAPQVRKAIKWLWNHSKNLYISRDNFNVLGHSAGGHLTAEMVFTDWSQEDQSLPKNLLHAAVAVSGIYDFEPILYCSENDGLRMDLKEAKAASTIHKKPFIDIPHILSFGLNEPPDMHRQSLDYVKAFSDDFSSLEIIKVDSADHFETVDEISNENGELFNKTLSLFKS